MNNQKNDNTKKLAELLDSKFQIPGTQIRFGIDPVIGLVPGVGDWITGVVSLYFLLEAAARRAAPYVLLRMLMNILADIIIGTIPLLGEIFDVGWKANLRNARLLEDLEEDPERAEQHSMLVVWGLSLLSIASVFIMLYVIGWIMISLIEVML